MENIDFLLLLTRWMHVSAALVAVGGAVFLRWVLLPGAKETLEDNVHERLRASVIKRWKKIVHLCVAVLLLTGGFNFYYLVLRTGIEPMPYHAIFTLKVLAAVFVFIIAIALTGSNPVAAGMREQSAKWLGVLSALALVVVLLSGLLGQLRAAG